MLSKNNIIVILVIMFVVYLYIKEKKNRKYG